MPANSRTKTSPLPFMIGGEYGILDEFFVKNLFIKTQCGPPLPCKSNGDDVPYDYVIPQADVLERSKKLGLFNLFRIFDTPTAAKIQACDPARYKLIIDTFRMGWDSRRPEYQDISKDFNKLRKTYLKPILAAFRKHGDHILICPTGERDSGCRWPDHSFRSRQEAYRWWKHYFFGTNGRQSTMIPGGVADMQAWLAHRGFHNLALHGAMLFSLHYYYEWGFPFVWLERGCELTNAQVAMAFLRGAARPYQGLWGIDYSTWSPLKLQMTWYDSHGRRRAGASESLMLRTWISAFLSGANLVYEEGSDMTHWVRAAKRQPRLSLAGQYAKRFADFALRRHPGRGVPYVSAAIMLDYYHGYNGPHGVYNRQATIWGGKIPVTADDAHITHVLEMFFPDNNLAWTMHYKEFNPKVPWKTSQEHLDMLRDGHDMRPYEKGHLVASPFGDCMDVILSTARPETLAGYPLIILAGRQEFSRVQSRCLLRYLENGGTLVAAFSQLPDEFLKQAKITVLNKRVGWMYDVVTCVDDNKKFWDHRYSYADLDIHAAGARKLVVNSRQAPLLWEISCGKGRLILSAVSHRSEITDAHLLPALQHVLAKYIDATLLVKATPATLQIIVTRGRDFLWIGALNNGDRRWDGALRVRLPPGQGAIASVRDIWNEAAAPHTRLNDGCSIRDKIEPFEFKVYRVLFKKQPTAFGQA